MSIKTLTGLNKAAVLLICLGEEATAKVFQELTNDEIRQLTRTMATIDHIPESIKDKVFANYSEIQHELAGLFVKGADFAKKAIESTGSDERTADLMERFISGTESRPLETIALMHPKMVAGLLEKNIPRPWP